MGRGVLAGLAGLAVAALVAGATAAGATAGRSATPAGDYVPGEVIVTFADGVGIQGRRSAASSEGATVTATLPVRGTALVELPDGLSVSTAIARLERRPDVVSAQPNFVYHAQATSGDPLFSLLWGLDNTGQPVGSFTGLADADIDAPEAWELTTGSSAVRVAVVDTGVEYDHPDLAANIGPLGPDFYWSDNDPRDENGHGTHVAGTIGAGNNGIGVVGVSWDVDLMPIRVLGPTGSGTTATITSGLRYAVQHGARIVNASLGGRSWDPLMESVIAEATGTLFVVAAGNGGGDGIGDDNDTTPIYPCSYASPNVICVAATDAMDSLAAFSNFGAGAVDLAAPGIRIGSTYAGGDYAYLQGTSMAAPHVAGTAALLLARSPGATVGQLRAALLGSVDVLPTLQQRVASAGRLNAHQALLALTPTPAPPAAPPPPPASPQPAAAPRPVKRVRKVVKKVAVCFRKRTIKIPKRQLAKYKKRGAKLGACKKPKKKPKRR